MGRAVGVATGWMHPDRASHRPRTGTSRFFDRDSIATIRFTIFIGTYKNPVPEDPTVFSVMIFADPGSRGRRSWQRRSQAVDGDKIPCESYASISSRARQKPWQPSIGIYHGWRQPLFRLEVGRQQRYPGAKAQPPGNSSETVIVIPRRRHPGMQAFGAKAEGLDFGADKLGKGGAVAFDGQKGKIRHVG